jgi:hypothetical protein
MKKRRYYTGGRTGQIDQSTTNMTNTAVNAISAIPGWGQLIGTGLKAGQAIGRTTKDEDGLYKSKAGEFFDNSLNPEKGIQNLKDNIKNLDDPSAIANQLSLGLFGKSVAERKAEEAKKSRQNLEVQNIVSNSEGFLESYPSKGVIGGTFKYGGIFQPYGVVPEVIDDSTKVDLSSDSSVYYGDKHEKGGIDLENGIEIEDEEVIKEDKVFSDRLKPSTEIKEVIEKIGFSTNKKETYADLTKRLLKEKGKYESSKNGLTEYTGTAMIPKIDMTVELLFADQQEKNGDNMGNKRAYGGGTDDEKPKKRTVPKDVVQVYTEKIKGDNIIPFVSVDETDPIFYDKPSFTDYYRNKAINALPDEEKAVFATYDKDMQDALILTRGGTPDFEIYQKYIRDFEKSQLGEPTDLSKMSGIDSMNKVGGYRYNARGGEGLPAKGSITKKRAYGGYTDDNPILAADRAFIPPRQSGIRQTSINDVKLSTPTIGALTTPDISTRPLTTPVDAPTGNNLGGFLNNNAGNIINALGTLSNQAIINKMQTNLNPALVNTPRFSYLDQSSPMLNRNNQAFREANLTLARSGRDSIGSTSTLFANKLSADSDIAVAEANRKQSAIDNYLNRVTSIDIGNKGTTNAVNESNLARNNQKLALTQQNTDNFYKGVLGNMAYSDRMQLDRDKATLSASSVGERGILERLRKDPKLAELLNRILG